jgi:outer membrane protein assembly factor BamB
MRHALLLGSILATAVNAFAQEWPQFRGPDGQGHAAAIDTPISWSEESQIAWKTPISGVGWSSPVINGNQIWLTTAIEEQASLRAICIDRGTGELLHDVEVFRKEDLGRVNAKNSHASPTPILAGDLVYVHFGAHGTACLSTDGRILWRTQLDYDHRHGPGGSPVLAGNVLVVACDGADVQYVVGLDARTGKTLWKTVREKSEMAYSTPLAIDVDGVLQVVSSSGGGVWAYNPRSGAEIWRSRYEGHSVIPRPVFANGLVYVCSGYWTPSVYAIRPDGTGDVTATHTQSLVRRGVPFTPSPLVVGNDIYLLTDMGVLTCVDLTTGKEHWRKRMTGNYSASPTIADGKIYVVSEEGATTVLTTGPKAEVLATNQLDGRSLASPAFLDGAIIYRSESHLYGIGNVQPITAPQNRIVDPAVRAASARSFE